VLVGLAPAFIAARADAGAVMRDGRGVGTGRRRRRLRDALVVAEFAISLVLVIGAGLTVRSLAKLRQVDTGVRETGLLTASVSLPGVRYSSMALTLGFTDRLLEQLRGTPGVEAAAITDGLPPDRLSEATNFKPERLVLSASEFEPIGDRVIVSDDYFRTMGIPLLAGRAFDSRDRTADTASLTVIINERFAKKYFADVNPLGQRIRMSGDTWVRVVGVVGNVRYMGLASSDNVTMYQPQSQMAGWTFWVVMRTSADPFALAMPLRRAVASIDPQIAVAQVQLARDIVTASTAANQFRALVLALLAGAALVLAAIGIYGVMSYAVSSRTREIGVRVALGARTDDVTALVLREGLARALAGVAAGLLAAWGATRLMSKLLFGVTATDPITFAGVPLVLLAVAAVACWLPARRAARVDPMVALRAE
jgi:putative ABC transport system permease protein